MLVWNVQRASPARAARQAAWLAQQPTADLLVLTEVSASTGGHALTRALQAHGYQVHAPSNPHGDYQVVLAARTGKLDSLPGVRPVCLPHRLLAARLHTPTLTLGLVGLYVPSRGPQARRNQAKRAFQQAVTALLPRLPRLVGQGGPLLVCGDLNVIEPGHQPAHRGVFAAWEYAFYQAVAASGLVDAFRWLHPTAVAHSWFGRRSGAGYRFDHAFITAPHASWLAACAYLHAPRLAGLSDHAALLTILTPITPRRHATKEGPVLPAATTTAAAAAHQRVRATIRAVDPTLPATCQQQVQAVPLTEPNRLRSVLAEGLAGHADQVVVTGLLERRLLALRRTGGDWLLADLAGQLPDPPLLVAGGSLTACNERLLLARDPRLLVARGAGEPTIADLLAYWHGDLPLEQVRGIGYAGAPSGAGTLGVPRFRHTPTVRNRAQTDFCPELDLLDRTFQYHGVAQLEASRGCTNACSFCPRSHKGAWAGAAPQALRPILAAVREVFDRHPAISRTIYLVDEECIRRGPNAVPRALAIADALHTAGFRWEASCRIDQVVRCDRDRDWHVERARMWRALVASGLRRCLFGVESTGGLVVDPICGSGTVLVEGALLGRCCVGVEMEARWVALARGNLDRALPAGQRGLAAVEEVRGWRDRIPQLLAVRGSAAVIRELADLVRRWPDRLWLKARLLEAEHHQEATWEWLSPTKLFQLLDDPRRRLVRSSAELCDVLVAVLGEIAEALPQHSQLLWNMWRSDTHQAGAPNEGTGAKKQPPSMAWRPKSEHDLSAYLKNQLELRLTSNATVVNREVLVRQTSPSGAGHRVDLLVEAIAHSGAPGRVPNAEQGGLQPARVVVEVKGCWHRELLTAMRTQLADEYLRDAAATCGVYVVGWYPLDLWDPDAYRRQDAARYDTHAGPPRPRTASSRPRPAARLDIRVVIIDVPHPTHTGQSSSREPAE